MAHELEIMERMNHWGGYENLFIDPTVGDPCKSCDAWSLVDDNNLVLLDMVVYKQINRLSYTVTS